MKKEKSPAFQFYPKDLLSDSSAMAMSNENLGVYIKLLCHDWINDGIPNDHQTIIRLSNFDLLDEDGELRVPQYCDEMFKEVMSKFVKHPEKPDFITNPRLLKERKKQEEFSRERSDSGKRGAKKRWQSNSSANSEPIAKNSSSSSSSSSSSNKKTKAKKEGFKKPTQKEVLEHFLKKASTDNEADKFFNFYESNGWKVGKNSMKSWTAAANGWITRNSPDPKAKNKYDTKGEDFGEPGIVDAKNF